MNRKSVFFFPVPAAATAMMAIVSLLFLSAGSAAAGPRDLADIVKAGKILIGCAEVPPEEGLKRSDLPYYMGFDLELALRISEVLRAEKGVTTEWVHVPRTDQRIPFLEEGKADLVIRTFSITPKRQEVIGFSNPYFENPGLTVVVGSDVQGVAGYKDLVGRKVIVTGKSTAEFFVLKNIPKVKILPVANDQYAIDYLIKGKADAYVQDFSMCLYHVSRFPSLRLAGEPFTADGKEDLYGIGMPKGSAELKNFIDGILARLEKDGTLKALYDKWYGTRLANARKMVPLIGGTFLINLGDEKMVGTVEEKRGDFYLVKLDNGDHLFIPPSSIRYMKVVSPEKKEQAPQADSKKSPKKRDSSGSAGKAQGKKGK